MRERPSSVKQNPMNIREPLTLPCGATIPNRIAKSAMSENMAEENHAPGERYVRLYERWARGGVGCWLRAVGR